VAPRKSTLVEGQLGRMERRADRAVPVRPWTERCSCHESLLVVDEIGYLPINHVGAVLFFQLINRRYETASTELTSNKDFEEWGEVLGDEVMAAALIERVLHHCHLVASRPRPSAAFGVRLRAGAAPAGIQASQALFISSKSVMLASQMLAARI
jgi:hypothetical protein